MSLLRQVFGIEEPEKYIKFEEQVKLDHTNFIDAYIPQTRVLIEQKGRKRDLRKPTRQADGSILTPFEQAKRYSIELPFSKHPRWVVACNFKEFHIYDMEKPDGEPIIVELKNLYRDYYLLQFLVEEREEPLKREVDISMAAGDTMLLLTSMMIPPANIPCVALTYYVYDLYFVCMQKTLEYFLIMDSSEIIFLGIVRVICVML